MKAAILSASFLQVSALAASPALASIRAAFPGIADETVSLVLSVPSLLSMVAFLLYGTALRNAPPKGMLVTGVLLVLIGGVGPWLAGNFALILCFRGLLGLGVGSTIMLTMRLIVTCYEGAERDALLGLQASVINLGGIFFSMVGGLLAARSWRYCFLIYLCCLPVLAAVLRFMPKRPEERWETPAGRRISAPALLPIATGMYFSAAIFIHNSFLSLLLADNGIGDAAFAGLASTCYMLGGLLSGLVFARLLRVLGRLLPPACMLLAAFCMLVIGVCPTRGVALTVSLLLGMCYTWSMPALISQLSGSLGEAGLIFACALFQAGNSVGQFFAGSAFSLVRRLPGCDTVNAMFAAAAVFLLVGGTALGAVYSRKKPDVGCVDSRKGSE